MPSQAAHGSARLRDDEAARNDRKRLRLSGRRKRLGAVRGSVLQQAALKNELSKGKRPGRICA
jgi:hypothetical protein